MSADCVEIPQNVACEMVVTMAIDCKCLEAALGDGTRRFGGLYRGRVFDPISVIDAELTNVCKGKMCTGA